MRGELKKIIPFSLLAAVLGVAILGLACPLRTVHAVASSAPMQNVPVCANPASNPPVGQTALSCVDYHFGILSLIDFSPLPAPWMLFMLAGISMLVSLMLLSIFKINLLSEIYRPHGRWRAYMKKKHGVILHYILKWLALQERSSIASASW